MVKRDADLKLQKISQHYEEKCQQLNRSVMIPPITIPPQQKRQFKVQDVQKMKIIEKVLKTMKSEIQHNNTFLPVFICHNMKMFYKT